MIAYTGVNSSTYCPRCRALKRGRRLATTSSHLHRFVLYPDRAAHALHQGNSFGHCSDRGDVDPMFTF